MFYIVLFLILQTHINSKPIMNYIRVFMNGQNPNPCEEESCKLTLVKKQLGNGRVLTNVMDKLQIDTEGEEALTIKITPLSQGSSQNGLSTNWSPNGLKGLSGESNFNCLYGLRGSTGPNDPLGLNGVFGPNGSNGINRVNSENGPNGRECSSGKCNSDNSRGYPTNMCPTNSQGCCSGNCPPENSSNQPQFYTSYQVCTVYV